ncbi:unnamed protein product [Owenia fusiformis]|uniref:Uncharacterized protein n=1 Tax=Owenia fusiformis TaxID=6347 RepID=A0A8S4Q7L1_OWEFU|nr:unnamed protein product [Owenia fusiformis]
MSSARQIRQEHDEAHDAQGYLLPNNVRYATINEVGTCTPDSNVETGAKYCTLKVAKICAIAVAVTSLAANVIFVTMFLKGKYSPCAVSPKGDLEPTSPDIRHKTVRGCLDAINMTASDPLEERTAEKIETCFEENNHFDAIGRNVTKMTSLMYDACPSGDFLLVRSNDHMFDKVRKVRPNCKKIVLGILTQHMLHSPEYCFYLACKVNANVVYYDPKMECAAYKCESNSDGIDWAYKWTDEFATYTGRTYARPHTYIQACHNSYFMRRTWTKSVLATCFRISDTFVKSLSECVEKACMDKANTLNFVSHRLSGYSCETQHCQWDVTTNDYVFNLRPHEDMHSNSVVYSLSHVTRPIKNLLQTEPVEFPMQIPGLCGSPGHFNGHKSTDREISNFFSESGSNTFIYVNGDKKFLAYTCTPNHEGTYWKFYDNKCYGDKTFSKWWIVPYPGTPNCKSDMFTLRRMGASCQKSNCDSSGSKKVSTARDLRQCMLHACEKGYNVINYFSNATSIVCELRNCYRYKGGDYNFRYEATGDTYGYDVYALQPDSNIYNSRGSNSVYAKYTISYNFRLDKT